MICMTPLYITLPTCLQFFSPFTMLRDRLQHLLTFAKHACGIIHGHQGLGGFGTWKVMINVDIRVCKVLPPETVSLYKWPAQGLKTPVGPDTPHPLRPLPAMVSAVSNTVLPSGMCLSQPFARLS